MLLYLLRHANADTVAATDDDRPLSDKGLKQARQVADFCKAQGIRPEIILTSPLPRALQTAEPVAAAVKTELKIVPWLSSGMVPETGLDELKAYRGLATVMITGHEPDFSAFTAHLMGLGSPTLVHFRKAALLALQIDVLRAGAARLEFSVPCKMMS